MNQRALIVAGLLFLIIVAGMFGYAYQKRTEMQIAIPTPPPPQKDDTQNITHIDAKHFINEVGNMTHTGTKHTIAGEIMMPTPCDLLESKATVQGPAPEHVVLILTVINNTAGACAHVPTAQRFKVSFGAHKDALITATFKDKPVVLNLIDARPNENPDDFELFIKG